MLPFSFNWVARWEPCPSPTTHTDIGLLGRRKSAGEIEQLTKCYPLAAPLYIYFFNVLQLCGLSRQPNLLYCQRWEWEKKWKRRTVFSRVLWPPVEVRGQSPLKLKDLCHLTLKNITICDTQIPPHNCAYILWDYFHHECDYFSVYGWLCEREREGGREKKWGERQRGRGSHLSGGLSLWRCACPQERVFSTQNFLFDLWLL